MRETDLVQGNIYYLAADYELPETVLSRSDLGVLIPCTFTGIAGHGSCVFEPLEFCGLAVINVKNGNYLIYKSSEAFLVDLVTSVLRVNEIMSGVDGFEPYQFDDYLKSMIIESQENHPESWI